MARPTKYKKEYCTELIAHMEEGYSFEAFAAECRVNKTTLYEWLDKYPEFSNAKKEGEMLSLKFWEREGIQGLWGSKDSHFNTTLWIFNMKNRFGWRDKKDVEVSGVKPFIVYDHENKPQITMGMAQTVEDEK